MDLKYSPLSSPDRGQSQLGQSLAECLVVCLALVPLFYLGIWLGKLVDLQLSTGEAAKKLAFECATRREDCKDIGANPNLVDALRVHQFSKQGREVLSLDSVADAPTDQTQEPLWSDHKGAPLLVKFSDVGAQTQNQVLNAPGAIIAGSNQRWVTNGLHLVSRVAGPDRFNLPIFDGFIRGAAQVNVSSDRVSIVSPARLDPIALSIRRQVALLTDEWGASGADNGRTDSIKQRVDEGSKLPIIEPVINAGYLGVRAAMQLMNQISLEHTATDFRFREIDVSKLPPDRKPGGAAMPANNPSPAGGGS
jgi:hypothetical protein